MKRLSEKGGVKKSEFRKGEWSKRGGTGEKKTSSIAGGNRLCTREGGDTWILRAGKWGLPGKRKNGAGI